MRLGKLLFYSALPFLHFGPRRQPRLRGLILDTDQHVLLVRNWFGLQQWELPGGGRKHHEPAKQALVREIREETGLKIESNDLTFIHKLTASHQLAPLHLTFYKTTVPSQDINHKNWEILELAWFPTDNLPVNCDKTVYDTLRASHE